MHTNNDKECQEKNLRLEENILKCVEDTEYPFEDQETEKASQCYQGRTGTRFLWRNNCSSRKSDKEGDLPQRRDTMNLHQLSSSPRKFKNSKPTEVGMNAEVAANLAY